MTTTNNTSTKREIEILEKVTILIEDSKDFDDEDVVYIKRIINIIRGFDSLGSFANIVKNVLVWLSVMIGIYLSFRNGLVEFILEAISNNRG